MTPENFKYYLKEALEEFFEEGIIKVKFETDNMGENLFNVYIDDKKIISEYVD